MFGPWLTQKLYTWGRYSRSIVRASMIAIRT